MGISTTAIPMASVSKGGTTWTWALDSSSFGNSLFLFDSSAASTNSYILQIDPSGNVSSLNGGNIGGGSSPFNGTTGYFTGNVNILGTTTSNGGFIASGGNVNIRSANLATSGGSFTSPALEFTNSVWSGTAAQANQWSMLEDTSNNLLYQYNGTTVAYLTSAGSLATSSSISATGTISATSNISAGGTVSMASSFMRNAIINGGMAFDRTLGAGVTATGYALDHWKYSANLSGKGTATQSNTALEVSTGQQNSLKFTSSSSYPVLAADSFVLAQPIEANYAMPLISAWGNAAAQPITLSFWAFSSLTGTFGGALQNWASTRAYPFSFSIPVANTATYISITIPGDTTGTWVTSGNAASMWLEFSMGMGTTHSGTAGAWVSSDIRSVTGAVSVVGTNAATFNITGVQLEPGSVATSFERRPFTTELELCQRYCINYNSLLDSVATFALMVIYTSVLGIAHFYFPVQMRANPSLTSSAGSTFNFAQAGSSLGITSIAINHGTPLGMSVQVTLPSNGAAGDSAWLFANSTTAAYITFDADF